MRDRSDFVQVHLTPAGVAMAGDGGVISLATSRMSYVFKAGESVEVLRAGEWPILRDEVDALGAPIFAADPDPVPALSADSVVPAADANASATPETEVK